MKILLCIGALILLLTGVVLVLKERSRDGVSLEVIEWALAERGIAEYKIKIENRNDTACEVTVLVLFETFGASSYRSSASRMGSEIIRMEIPPKTEIEKQYRSTLDMKISIGRLMVTGKIKSVKVIGQSNTEQVAAGNGH